MSTEPDRLWHVLGFGEGFTRNGTTSSVEITGLVRAVDPSRAWEKAVALARIQSPEIAQTDSSAVPRPVLNCDEINEATSPQMDMTHVDQVELHWNGNEG